MVAVRGELQPDTLAAVEALADVRYVEPLHFNNVSSKRCVLSVMLAGWISDAVGYVCYQYCYAFIPALPLQRVCLLLFPVASWCLVACAKNTQVQLIP